MPFITEELWHELQSREDKDCIIVAPYPNASTFDRQILDEALWSFEVITEIRNARNTKNISPKEALKLVVRNGEQIPIHSFWSLIRKLSNLSEVVFVKDPPSTNATQFIVRSQEFFIPLEGKVDADKEKESIRKEIEYQKGFLQAVDKKLSNEKFVSGAPSRVLEMERKKKSDAEARIKALEENLQRF